MGIWTAKCWLGSESGYQQLEVKANTWNGAKSQLERIYGAEQIINLHEVSSASDSNGGAEPGGILLVLFLFFAIAAWKYILIIGAIAIAIWVIMSAFKE
jgi:high-affinity Fe2+/Pb2+ permease